MRGISRIDQVTVPRLRRAREYLEDNDLPVTLTRLARQLGIPVSSLWHVLNEYAPWLKEELKLAEGFRDDDLSKSRAYWAAIRRLRIAHGVWAYFLVADELEQNYSTVKEYVRTHGMHDAKGKVSNWEARYRMAARDVPETRRTVPTLAEALQNRFRIGSENHVRAYLRRNPQMIPVLGVRGYQPRL